MTNVVAIQEFKTKRLSLDAAQADKAAQNQHWIDCLIKVARKHDQQAFQQLFQHFAPKVKSFYLKHRLSESTAEELMQETFISVWKFANYFEANKGQVSTWLFTIARNKELDFYRKNKRQVSTTELISEDMAVESGEQFDEQLHMEMGQFIPQLPAEQIEVVQKVYFEELSHQKAADALNLTLGTVKGRLRSAINNLNKLMRGLQ